MTNSLSTPTDPRMYQFPVTSGPQTETFRGQQAPELAQATERIVPSSAEASHFLEEPRLEEAEISQALYAARLAETAPSQPESSQPEIDAARDDVRRHVDVAPQQPQESVARASERAAYIDPVETSALATQLSVVLEEHRSIVLRKSDLDLAA